MVRRTPTLPLVAPPNDRKKRACQKDCEKPKPRHEITGLLVCFQTNMQDSRKGGRNALVPVRPIIKTVLRPNRRESARRPHIMAVRNWAAVKLACRMPDWLAMTELGKSGRNDRSW